MFTRFHKSALAVVAATAAFAAMVPAVSHAQHAVVITNAPPAPVYEVAPAPRAGWVWAPGHHQWRGNQYVWVQGQWMQQRPDQEYRIARWVERNGQWQMVGGDWVRRGPNGDRDRDGIPNAYDRDRDGDGIANRNDDQPNQPNQYGRRDRFGPNGDLDRDGIANRNDRDRDGDGIRNHRDRYPDDRRRS